MIAKQQKRAIEDTVQSLEHKGYAIVEGVAGADVIDTICAELSPTFQPWVLFQYTIKSMPEALQRVIGYELNGSSTLGWLDGRDPREVLHLDNSPLGKQLDHVANL